MCNVNCLGLAPELLSLPGLQAGEQSRRQFIETVGYRDDASKGIAQWERGEMAMRIYVTPVDGYDAEAAKFLGHFEAFVTGEFGDRCSTFDVDCPCCKMWKLYDETKVIVEI